MKKNIIRLLILLATLWACVPSSKHKLLMKQKVDLEAEYAICQDSLKKKRAQYLKALNALEDYRNYTGRLKDDSAALAENLQRTKAALDEQTAMADRLRKDYKDLLANYSAESNKLAANLARKEQQLLDLEKSLQTTKANNDQLAMELAEREKKLREMERLLRKQDSTLQAVRNKVSEALNTFKDGEISVRIKDGKVYLSLSEKLLFQSGSTKVDKNGVEALKKLAEAMRNQPDITVMVEGHTDDVPVSKKSAAAFEDNWDLSVLRATEITRILISEGMDGKRITAAGRSEYDPVMDAKTAEARQKNRRTEIILAPRLDELYKLLEKK